MSVAGKHALITGINGFTGRYVAAELSAAGYRVFGLGATPFEGPDYYQVDLMDVPALTDAINLIKPNVVVHLTLDMVMLTPFTISICLVLAISYKH